MSLCTSNAQGRGVAWKIRARLVQQPAELQQHVPGGRATNDALPDSSSQWAPTNPQMPKPVGLEVQDLIRDIRRLPGSARFEMAPSLRLTLSALGTSSWGIGSAAACLAPL